MPRTARLVVPGYPHHVTQRGNRRQRTFFEESDYLAYLKLIGDIKVEAGVEIWAYCLMPNHVHFIAIPEREDSLASLFGKTHARYSKRVNQAKEWRGHLWQQRFHSVVMDEPHVLAAVRYVELNPVRAGLCSLAEEWPWSSARGHLGDASDSLLACEPMQRRILNWRQYLSEETDHELVDRIRKKTRSGQAAGNAGFVEKLERLTGRDLRPRKPGRPRLDDGVRDKGGAHSKK